MELRLLEIFCRVFEARSFSRAAAELGLAQPTISVHIKDLEQSLGAQLFNRLGREIEPTDAGEYLYAQAMPIFRLKRDLADRMASFLNRIEGELIIGASSVPGECLLPGVITRFLREYPGVRLKLRISDSSRALQQLRQGEVELAVIGATTLRDDLRGELFAADQLVLVSSVTGAWSRPEICLRELRGLPLIIREEGSGTRVSLDGALAGHGVRLAELHVIAELGRTAAIVEAVRMGCGLSFVSALAVRRELRDGTLRVVRVPELGPIPRTFYSVVNPRRELSPTSRAFRDCLRHAARCYGRADAPEGSGSNPLRPR